MATIAVRGVISSRTGRSEKANTPETTAISSDEASAWVSKSVSAAARAERGEAVPVRLGTKGPSKPSSRSTHGSDQATIGSAQRRPITRGTRYETETSTGTATKNVNTPMNVGVVRASIAGSA